MLKKAPGPYTFWDRKLGTSNLDALTARNSLLLGRNLLSYKFVSLNPLSETRLIPSPFHRNSKQIF